MVFSSFLFLFYFLPIALLIYHSVPRRAQHLVLTLLSLVFYGWANPLFSFLLLFSTGVDYIAGLVIALGAPKNWRHPIHRLDQQAGQGQPQAGALDVGALRAKTLERGEQEILLGRRNTWATVRYQNTHHSSNCALLARCCSFIATASVAHSA